MITLFLMGQKGHETLKSLIKNSYVNIIDQVILSKDKNIQEDFFIQIMEECKRSDIPFFERNNLVEIKSKYLIAISWRWLIKIGEDQKLIVLHDSLLPRLRGYNPLVTALINGDREIGVSAIFAEDAFDKGDVIDYERINISYPIKIQRAIELISICYSNIICRLFQQIKSRVEVIGVKQVEKLATYSVWRDEMDYYINWNQKASQIIRFINAVGFPYQGAKTLIDNKEFKVEDAVELSDIIIENRTPGKVIYLIEEKPVVICGEGLIRINSLIDVQSGFDILPLKRFRTRFI